MPCTLFTRSRRQQGVAAIEFALIAALMVTLLLGLLVFWRAFQVQQSLNRAAGDGARSALTLITMSASPCNGNSTAANRTAIQTMARKVIEQHLEQSKLATSNFSMNGSAWTCPPATTPPTRGEGTFSFDVQYTLPPLLGGSGWISEPASLRITDRIVVHFPTL